MIERIALVVLLSAALAVAYFGLRRWHVRRMQPIHGDAMSPTLLYFRGDHCAVCPAQERAINQLATLWDAGLHVERIDAERDAEMAARYGVFTLPTTIWIDADGRVRQVNYGLADARKLERQAAELVAQPQTADRRPQTTFEPLSGSGHPKNILDKGLS